jgi:ribonucleotide reductase beta subunit family protein with ferritin-like domain
MSVEPLSDDKYFRLTTLPIEPQFQVLWDLYKKQEDSFWKAEEVDFSNDRKDYLTLNDNEQQFVKMILAFFAASDGIVNFNIGERFMNEIKVAEARVMLGFQYMMENIHGEVYSNMLNNIVEDSQERQYLFNAIKNIPSIKAMKDWAFRWIYNKSHISYAIFAAGIVEGVFFSGAFASIYWLKLMKGKNKLFMQGLIKSNKLISRDEGMHTNSDAALYSFIQNRIPVSDITAMITEAVELVDQFHYDGIQVSMIGMNTDMMQNYVRYVADRLLVMFGYDKIFLTKNPFPFMELIGINSKDNFFETRVDAYQGAHNEENEGWNFETCEDF